MDRTTQERLKWKCRRGLLELDLVFQRFVPTLKDEEADSFAALLDLPDNDLWDIVAGRSDHYAPGFRAIVARLRAA
ncbi:MAG TPA: succinate dehydrogenase assembly factor 2 [Burkholderiales bacterium]|jgi:antitoxin CptB